MVAHIELSEDELALIVDAVERRIEDYRKMGEEELSLRGKWNMDRLIKRHENLKYTLNLIQRNKNKHEDDPWVTGS